MRSSLSHRQQILLDAAVAHPGRFARSGLAKLLVGSRSARLSPLPDDPFYGRLAGHGRKAITEEIDELLRQGMLALDARGRIVPGVAPENELAEDEAE